MPTGSISTANFDSGGDSPAQARADLLSLIQKFNTMVAHSEPAKKDGSNASGTWGITAERVASAFAGVGIDISTSQISISHSHSPSRAELIPGGSDLNTYQTPGFYYQPTNANASSGSDYPAPLAVSLVVLKGAGVSQVYIEYDTASPTMYLRSYYGGSWGAWEYMTTSRNFGGLFSPSFTTALAATNPVNASNLGANTAAPAAKSVGTLAFAKVIKTVGTNVTVDIGDTEQGGNLYTTSASGNGESLSSGTWRCLGRTEYGPSITSEPTLWQRIS